MKILSYSETIQMILQRLQLHTSDLTDNHFLKIIIAEYFRYRLNNCCLTKENNIAPVYQQQVINHVYNHLKPLFAYPQKQSDHSIIKIINWQLQTIRDISRLSGGYILPAPIRAIQMPCSDYVIFTGGIETKSLSEIIGETVKIAGFARYIHLKKCHDDTFEPYNILWQSYRAYINDEITDLKEWMALNINQAKERLNKVSVDSSLIDIYYPQQQNHQFQNKRWIHLYHLEKHNGELLFCRIREGKSASYIWGELSKTHPFRLKRESSVHFKDIHKICYGIDDDHNCPTTVSIRQQDDSYAITLNNKLPRSHQRIFLALTQQKSKNTYYFNSIFKNDIIYFLEQLGIQCS